MSIQVAKQEFKAMTPAQYTVLTGLVSPCSCSNGLLVLVAGFPLNASNITLKSLHKTFARAESIAAHCNTQTH